VKKILDFVGMSIGSWAGWALGIRASVFVAFICSVIGLALGTYLVRRYVRPHLL
jgi:hypothetical protein